MIKEQKEDKITVCPLVEPRREFPVTKESRRVVKTTP